MSDFFFTKWRFCYQRRLPHLVSIFKLSAWKVPFIQLIGVQQNMICDQGEGGLANLIFSYKGRRGRDNFRFLAVKVGRGVLNPQFVADIIGEQPLRGVVLQNS